MGVYPDAATGHSERPCEDEWHTSWPDPLGDVQRAMDAVRADYGRAPRRTPPGPLDPVVEVLPPPAGPSAYLPPDWPERLRDDVTAMMERHARSPYMPGDWVMLDHRVHVVATVDSRGIETVPVRP